MAEQVSGGGPAAAAGGAAGPPGDAVAGPPSAVELDTTTGPVPVVRRRRRESTARPRAVFARLSEQEFEVVGVAAAAAGVTPTSYVAAAAVAVARGEVRPVPSGVGEVVRELVDARLQLVRYGVLLNQAVARLNATGEVDGSLLAAARRCDAATAAVRAATERLGRRR